MTQAPPRPQAEDEIVLGNKSMFAMGFLGAIFVVIALAFGVLMGRTSTPNYTGPLVLERTEVGAAETEVTLIGTEFAYVPMDAAILDGGTLSLVNQGSIIHNVELEGVSGFVVEAQAGETASATVDVAAGTYVMFCSIPGHREAGMVGTLTIVGG